MAGWRLLFSCLYSACGHNNVQKCVWHTLWSYEHLQSSSLCCLVGKPQGCTARGCVHWLGLDAVTWKVIHIRLLRPWIGPSDVYSDTWGPEFLFCRCFARRARWNPIRLMESLSSWRGGRRNQERGSLLEGHLPQNPEPRYRRGRGWDPAGSALPPPEDLLPHLRQPLISVSLCARAANNQLKLADFSTFVREPAALAQLSICRKGSREPEKKKKKKKLLSHYSYSFPYSLPHPLTVSTAMPLSSPSSFFKKSFYNNLSLYVVRAPGILPVTCL